MFRVCRAHDDTSWNNTVLCLPLSHFSSSALPSPKFHCCDHRWEGPVVSPPSWNNRKHSIIFPPLDSFSTLIQNISLPVWHSLSMQHRVVIVSKMFLLVCVAQLFSCESSGSVFAVTACGFVALQIIISI